MLHFCKCGRQHAVHVAKATGKKAAVLKRLRSFLDAEEPQTVRWLVSFWDKQQTAVTYKEIREAILSGGMTEKQLRKWQKDYAKLVNTVLAPQWEQAMAAAAQERIDEYPYFRYEPSVAAAQDYIKQHGAQLITNLAAEQKNAIQAMVTQAAHYNGMTADSLSRMIRPVIGLTKPQAIANMNYYNAMRDNLLKAHPRMTAASAEKKARDAAARYAARQHRYRAQNIARTELAAAYNQGGYGATKDAQAQGYIGDCKKTWLTADDERVCPHCGAIDMESVNIDAPFSIGKLLPPAHPQCRCAVAYEEITGPMNPAAGGSQTEPQTAQPTPATVSPSVVPQSAVQNPLPQTGDTVTPEGAAQTSGGQLQATDVFGDLSVVPESSFGVSVRSDSMMVEGQNLTARRITIDSFTGEAYYEISGKLTEETWEAAAKNIKTRGRQSTIEFEKKASGGLGDFDDGEFSVDKQMTLSGRPITLDGYKLMTADGASFEVYGDYSNKRTYSFGGYFRVRVPVTGSVAADTRAMTAVLDKAGLSGLTVNPTAADDLLLRKSRLVWQHAPGRVIEYESLTGADRERKLDEILKSVGISQQRVAGMEWREVFPGYSTYVDAAAAAQYRRAGLINVWAGVDNVDAVVAITQTNGLVATNYKVTSGMKIWGASPEADMTSGGADSVFTRIGVKTRDQYDDSYKGGPYRIIIDPEEMSRTDWYSFDSDRFGRSRDGTLLTRDAPVDFIQQMGRSYRSGNEIMFRHGISRGRFLGIACENATVRQELLDKYRAAGVTHINGKTIDKFIYVSTTIGK